MRLLKIGRDVSNDIVLRSERVSSLHAEITLMDSGDILLEDRGSQNGTFVQNTPIRPGKPVSIRRGDAIRFADVELQWSQIPMPEDNSAYKAIYGIGSHLNNDIQLTGDTVSRYHATIKVGKDNKVYIVDHSKNGTTVDGQKITPNTPFRIKKSSAIVCGRVPVPLKTAPIQWPSTMKTILATAAAILILAGIGFGAWKVIGGGKSDLKSLEKATACVFEQYYIQVTFKDDPFIVKLEQYGWPRQWKFGLDNEGNIALGTLTNTTIRPLSGRATAFFISEKGELGTNRHVARPWEYIGDDTKEAIKQIMEKNLIGIGKLGATLKAMAAEGNISEADYVAWLTRLQKSEIEISGSFDFIGVALTGTNVTTISDFASCQVIAESGDQYKDVAMLRLNTKKTPDHIIKGGFFDIENSRTDETSLSPQADELTTIGYPAQFGTGENLIGKDTEFLPTVHRTYISKTPDDDMFQLQSNVVGGQSGSPIIDKDHRLVGVVWGSIRGTEVAYGCNIKHLKALYDKNKARE